MKSSTQQTITTGGNVTQNRHNVKDTPEKNLFITMVLNFAITAAEVIGGIYSGSLSLISDALHNFSDGIAIIITHIAMRLSKKPRTLKYTFGLKRAELLAAIINASTLIIISFFLIKEAIDRFSNPTAITGNLMLAVAVVGLVANVAGTLLLKKGSERNINIRAAYFHLLSDAVSSLAVIFGAVCIMVFNITWIDPALTILISFYILKETYSIVKEAVDVIMMSSPAGINVAELRRAVEAIPGVRNIHHVHLWKVNDSDIHFEAHINVDDIPLSRTAEIRKKIEATLHDKHEIDHSTLQFECGTCSTKDLA
ncbi:MAG: cation diffusion facilitator family transporter [Bacteroidota bacterium]